MARYIAAQTGNWGTSTTWDTVANTPALAATDQTITTTPTASASFTAPNTTNAVTGVALYLTNKAASGSPTTITVTLQEAGVSTAATKTLTLANVNLGWIYFRFPTPYVYTAITANRYRIVTSVDSGTCTIAFTPTATTLYMATDDRHAVPGADNVWVLSHNEKSPITVTMDGTRTCGNTNVASSVERSITNGLIVGPAATLSFDTTASSQLTVTGPTYVSSEGELNIGSTGSPLSSSYTARLLQSGAAGNANFAAATGAKVRLQGTPKSSTTLWKGTYASGAGTAASPLIMNEAVDWSVGDEIAISANSANATNYNETESRFIITKNSATSYVVSTTSGGAEAALTYTHAAGSLVTNIQRNIVLGGIGASNGQSFIFNSQPNTTNIDIDWARFEYIDPTLFFGVAPIGYVDINDNVSIDYSVGYYGATDIFRFNTKTTAQTHTGLVTYSPVATAAGITAGLSGNFVVASCQGQTFNNCYSLQSGSSGFSVNSSFTNAFNECKAFSSNTGNTIPTAGGFLSISSGQNAYIDCEGHANRGGAVRLSTSLGETFTECLFGTKGANSTSDVLPVSSTYNDVLFDSCTFGSASKVTNYLNQTIGSEIRFNRINDTDNVHEWYTVYGYGASESTVIRSPGLSVKLVPENLTTGFTWSFQVPATANSIVAFRGFFLKNATLGTSVVTIGLYLPGNPVSSGLPDDSVVLNNTTGASFSDANEQPVNLVANYTGDIPGVAVVTINVKSNTAGAALYADDFFNAGDRSVTFDQITGLNTWVDGKPISVIQPSVPSADDTAAAVWSYLTANMITPNSAGAIQKKTLTTPKFLGLK